MPNDPTVCAVMLTRDRPEYARRAVECFRAQTYERKRLLIWDNSESLECCDQAEHDGVIQVPAEPGTIGQLRNRAVAFWTEFQIIVHWDDDDYSHPSRISEQVALLQASGADAVGYREVLFWDKVHPLGGRAFLYTNPDPSYCLGTSLCYWRKTWERNPFSERNGANPRERGEDREFRRGIRSLGVPSIPGEAMYVRSEADKMLPPDHQPRMIARIHAGNAAHYPVDELVQARCNWWRAPEWDARCREVMECQSTI